MLKTLKYIFATILVIGLVMTSAFFTLLLYLKITDQEFLIGSNPDDMRQSVAILTENNDDYNESDNVDQKKEKLESAFIDAPVVLQLPELYNGCEIATLTMMFNFYGIDKSKMDLLPELKQDPTPIEYNKDGSIRYWGNPNLGFVGDITGKKKGYGIYHTALFELLIKYIPTGIDFTGKDFDELEQQVSDGFPVLVWTTVSYTKPSEKQWMVWDSPLGPIRTTFQEHTVLLVGYDNDHVFINDPRKNQKGIKVDKKQFIESWEALGKQALSYRVD